MHDIKITSPDGLNPRGTTLEIDGKPYPRSTAVRFEITADNWASAEIAFIPEAFSFEGKAQLRVDAETAELLTKLGWTPPKP